MLYCFTLQLTTLGLCPAFRELHMLMHVVSLVGAASERQPRAARACAKSCTQPPVLLQTPSVRLLT